MTKLSGQFVLNTIAWDQILKFALLRKKVYLLSKYRRPDESTEAGLDYLLQQTGGIMTIPPDCVPYPPNEVWNIHFVDALGNL